MNLLREVASELLGMFLADARLTGAVLALVLLVAVLLVEAGMAPLLGGTLLLGGCLVILVEAAIREARRRR
jgi:hypothetical protein